VNKSFVNRFACAGAVFVVASTATAQFDPPAGYYSGATGTGATLKGQLTDAMSAGHIQRTYGNFRNSSILHDADPDIPGNILLVYNRFSISGVWNSGIGWNREHVWPQSRQPGSANNSSQGNLGDPHAVRPCTPSINSDRGNLPFSEEAGGPFGGGGWDPGVADRGDIARCVFYSDTRWGPSLGLTLVRSTSLSGNQMGDLDELIRWHYEDVPDTFERRRNHVIATQAENPSFFTNNRSAYVDRPEFVWSVYQDQANDTRLFFGAADADGGSNVTIDLGSVFAGTASGDAAAITLEKLGEDGTYFDISISGDITSTDGGRFNAFPLEPSGTDMREISVTPVLNAGTPAGLVSGTITIDNLDVTTMGGMGRGANDADDTATVELSILDRANGSFDGASDVNTFSFDFGEIDLGAGDGAVMFQIHNLPATPGFTAGLDAELASAAGDTAEISIDFTDLVALAAGGSAMFSATLSDAATGSFSATYTLSTFDDRTIDGFIQGADLVIELSGSVASSVCLGDCDESGTVEFNDLIAMLFEFGNGPVTACDADESGDVDFNDLITTLFLFGPCP